MADDKKNEPTKSDQQAAEEFLKTGEVPSGVKSIRFVQREGKSVALVER